MNHTRKSPLLLLTLAVTTLPMMLITDTRAVMTAPVSAVAWTFYQHDSADQLRDTWQHTRESGFMPVDIEAAGDSQQHLSIWEHNRYGDGWVSWHGLTEQEFTANVTHYKDRGYLIADQDLSVHGSSISYSLLMRENVTGDPWTAYTAIDAQQLQEALHRHKEDLQPVAIDAMQYGDQSLYSILFSRRTVPVDWRFENALSHDDYLQRSKENKADDYQPVDVTCYLQGDQLTYAAIWQRRTNAWAAYHGMDATELRNRIRQLADQGLRLTRVTTCPTQAGQAAAYAGIWAVNDNRFYWPARETAQRLLDDYESAADIPGVSAAIVHNGQVLFRGGAGLADQQHGIAAHSGSIYRLASISKAIVGTLAFQLAQQQKISLDTPTREVLSQLSPGHRHTLRQLLKNTGCVKSYEDDGYDDNKTHTQYHSATDALDYHLAGALASDEWIIEDCTPGQHHYSTHGYTHATAVLEAATGKTFDTLVKEYISDPLHLNSLQAEVRSTPAFKQERAELTYQGHRTSADQFQNVSWKAGGSGMEASALDLALFGDAVLRDRYFDRNVREAMWSGGDNDSELHGWTRIKDRGEIEKGGVNQGTDVHIRLDPATGISVVAMTNTVMPATRTLVLTEKLMDLAKKQLQSTAQNPLTIDTSAVDQ